MHDPTFCKKIKFYKVKEVIQSMVQNHSREKLFGQPSQINNMVLRAR